jgi:hypothetical protein
LKKINVNYPFALNYVINYCAMNICGGGEWRYNFTVLALDVSEWLASCSYLFTPRDISPIPIV